MTWDHWLSGQCYMGLRVRPEEWYPLPTILIAENWFRVGRVLQLLHFRTILENNAGDESFIWLGIRSPKKRAYDHVDSREVKGPYILMMAGPLVNKGIICYHTPTPTLILGAILKTMYNIYVIVPLCKFTVFWHLWTSVTYFQDSLLLKAPTCTPYTFVRPSWMNVCITVKIWPELTTWKKYKMKTFPARHKNWTKGPTKGYEARCDYSFIENKAEGRVGENGVRKSCSQWPVEYRVTSSDFYGVKRNKIISRSRRFTTKLVLDIHMCYSAHMEPTLNWRAEN